MDIDLRVSSLLVAPLFFAPVAAAAILGWWVLPLDGLAGYLVLAWTAMAGVDLLTADSWRTRLGKLAGTTSMILILIPVSLASGGSWGFYAAAAGLTLISFIVSWRETAANRTATEAIQHAFTRGDYGGTLAAAREAGVSIGLYPRGELMTLVKAHVRRSEFAEAEALLRQALARQKNLEPTVELTAALAGVAIEQHRFDEAATALDAAQALAGPHRHPRVAEQRALLHLRRGGNAAAALAESSVGVRLETDRAAIIHAWALAENGRAAEARLQLGAWEPERQSMPALAQCAYLAGRALLAAGDPAEADARFRRAAEAEPSGLYGQRAREALAPAGLPAHRE